MYVQYRSKLQLFMENVAAPVYLKGKQAHGYGGGEEPEITGEGMKRKKVKKRGVPRLHVKHAAGELLSPDLRCFYVRVWGYGQYCTRLQNTYVDK
jgi:hypothetical protein